MQMKALLILLLSAATAFGQLSAAEAKRRMDELNSHSHPSDATAHASTQPAATQPGRSPQDLYAAAMAFIRAGQYIKASLLIDQAYKLTPPTQMTRPLILNRALTDYMVGTNVQRAIKELSAYVSANPLDEMAVDMLGASGRKAMDHVQRFEATALAIDAEHVLSTAVKALENTRPGMHKWGMQWLDNIQFDSIAAKQHHAQFVYDQALSRVRDAQRRLDQVKADTASQNTISTAGGVRGTGVNRWYVGDGIAQKQQDDQQRAADAQSALGRAQADLRDANARADDAKRAFPQPEWPAAFEPLDSDVPATMPGVAVAAVATPTPFDPRFAAAIAAHQLAVGMTIDQATAALGQGTVIHDDGRHQTYKWKAPVDTQPAPNLHTTFTAVVENGIVMSFSRHD